MKLNNKDIQIKSFGCNYLGEPGKKIHPYVNIFVKVTNGCNAKCLFCSNADSVNTNVFNVSKLFDIINEIQEAGILVNRVNITGGEPSLVPDRVFEILEKADNNEFSDIHFHLNTNGVLPQAQEVMQHARWNSISMSVHHYDCSILSHIYGRKVSESAFELSNIDKRKINFSCDLIRGYIDSPLQAHRRLDFTLNHDIHRIGFVALMPISEYCKKQFVDLEEIALDSIPNVYYTYSKDRGKDCKCSNYLYNRGLKILEIYMRNYMNPLYCESSLVYDGEFFRQGFQNDNIIC